MRQRLRPRARAMARRPGSDDQFTLSPRARRIGGWVAAALLIGGIALAFRLLGGNGDGTVVQPSPSSSTATAGGVSFGTALDPATGEVAADARTTRFTEGDAFAYSVAPSASVPAAVYVEVRRAGTTEPVQAPVDAQPLANPAVIAFTVPADALLAAFGPGEYELLVYADPTDEPIAAGVFELIGPAASPSASQQE